MFIRNQAQIQTRLIIPHKTFAEALREELNLRLHVSMFQPACN